MWELLSGWNLLEVEQGHQQGLQGWQKLSLSISVFLHTGLKFPMHKGLALCLFDDIGWGWE